MRVILFLQVADCGRLPADWRPRLWNHEGNDVMYKVCICCRARRRIDHGANAATYSDRRRATAGGRRTKNAKTKKEPSAGQLAARERQKKCAAEWKEAKAGGKVEKDTTWPKYLERLQQASQVSVQIARTKTFQTALARTATTYSKKTEGVGETLKSRRRPLLSSGTGAPRNNRIALITP